MGNASCFTFWKAFPMGNALFPTGNARLEENNEPFPVADQGFPQSTGAFPAGNGSFPLGNVIVAPSLTATSAGSPGSRRRSSTARSPVKRYRRFAMAKTKNTGRILDAVHETARDLHAAGFVSKRRMKDYDALCTRRRTGLCSGAVI
jgi:hypothetical protein